VIIFFCLVSCVLSQQQQTKFFIDQFNSITSPLVIIINTTTVFPQSLSASTVDSTIVGGERDLILTVLSGPAGRILSTSVDNQQWDVSTPNAANGFAVQQYDGIDGSPNLNKKGLNGFNFLQNGGNQIQCSISTDITTIYSFAFTDMVGGANTQNLSITGGTGLNDFFLPFSQFKGVDLTNTGSLEITINAFDNVDTFVDFFSVVGPAISSSPTPSPQKSAPSTPTATPGSSPSHTPIVNVCNCFCPLFTCELIF